MGKEKWIRHEISGDKSPEIGSSIRDYVKCCTLELRNVSGSINY